MAKYDVNDCGTLDVKVGETFELEKQLALVPSIDTNLVLQKNAFKIISKTSKPLPKNKDGIPPMGVMPPEVYTLEALSEGSYKLDYQTIFRGKISSVDQYTVNVRK